MTSRGGEQDGAFFGKRLGLGRLWGGGEFAMDFGLVDMEQALGEQRLAPSSSRMDSAARWGISTATADECAVFMNPQFVF